MPDDSARQVIVSLTRMNRIRAIDAANLTMTVDAGCVLQAAQEAAAGAGLLLPLSLAAEGSCTIGGNLGTNAGGTQVLRYGNARELCLGLEVVTAAGEVWDGLSGLRKDNTGYDLRDLFIGSEGTLGIITAATLKLYPLPAARLTAWASVPSLESAVRLGEALGLKGISAMVVGGMGNLGGSIAGLWHRDLPILRSTEPASLESALAKYDYLPGVVGLRQEVVALLRAVLAAGLKNVEFALIKPYLRSVYLKH